MMPTPPDLKAPPLACDCHVHVFGPGYGFVADRAYTPGSATLEELCSLHERLGIERVVIVQPSRFRASREQELSLP